MMDGAVNVFKLYDIYSHVSTDNLHEFAVLGLSNGAAVVLSLDVHSETTGECACQLLPGGNLHGAVQALLVGDITNDGTNSIMIGYEDGTLLLAVLDDHEEEREVREGLRFVEKWSTQLPFAILGLERGQLFEAKDRSYDVSCHQIAVLTSKSMHIFIPTFL